ncbi:MAG: outer membrane protein assembly factor BamA [Gemmatimonadales bacterium]
MRRMILAAACAAAASAMPCLGFAQAPAPGQQVDSIEVVGTRRVSPETIRNVVAIPLHISITYRDIQRAIRSLFDLGQFDDIQVSRRSGANNEEILAFTVHERPLLVRFAVRGAINVSERSVRDKIELVAGRPLDPALVAKAVVRIDSLYETGGYYLSHVRVDTIGGDTSGSVRIVFGIEEGRRVEISAVRIDGNTAFPDAAIVGHMKTKPEGFWWFQHGEYNESTLREDLDSRLPEFYGSQGYIDFRVVKDTLLVDQHNGKATLVVQVDEGRPYRVGTVTTEGNRFFTTEQVMSVSPFAPRSGAGLSCLVRSCEAPVVMFDQAAWDAATQKLRTQYANEGYIYASVQPAVERVPASDSSGAGVVNVAWIIDEKRPAIINRVEITGNDVTHERVIREAIVILPGDVFAQDRIIRSYQNISNLGFFQQPMPYPDTKPANDQGDIDLIFKVQEKHTGNINFGASVGQGTGVGGFLGLEEPNLWGQGKRGKLQWQFGSNINDFSLTYADPALWDSRVSGQVEVHDSRLRYTVANLGQITTQGGDIQVGFPLPKSRYSRLFLNTGLDWEHYQGGSQVISASALTCYECLRTYVGISLMRDTRVELPFPTGGSMHQATITFNGPFNTGTATFNRYDLEGHWYTPVARLGGGPSVGGISLTIGLSAKAGFVSGDPGPFFRQLFAMGGTQYGIPLRGYDEFSITPAGFNPNASTSGVPQSAFGKSYFASTAEFGVRITPQIYASLFYDAGNNWATASGFNPTRLFRGAGVGVALITPLGPLGLDWAYGFDRVDVNGNPDPGWKLHFKVGNFF